MLLDTVWAAVFILRKVEAMKAILTALMILVSSQAMAAAPTLQQQINTKQREIERLSLRITKLETTVGKILKLLQGSNPQQQASSSPRQPARRISAVEQRIRAQARKEFPDDYTTQRYVIREQMKAYRELHGE